MKRTEKLIKAGWMIKSPPQGSITSVLKSWEDRYFTLVQITVVYSDEHWEITRFLRYYRTREEYVGAGLARGEIPLKDCLSATSHKPIKNYRHVISLESRNRIYYLCLLSKEEQADWLHVLQKNLPLTVQWQLAHRRQRDLDKNKSHLSSVFLGRKKDVSRRRLSDVSGSAQSYARNGRGRQRISRELKSQSVIIETKEETLLSESTRSVSVCLPRGSIPQNEDTHLPLTTSYERERKRLLDGETSTGNVLFKTEGPNQSPNYDDMKKPLETLSLHSSTTVGDRSVDLNSNTDTDYVLMQSEVSSSVSASFTWTGDVSDSRDRTSSTSSSGTEDVITSNPVQAIQGEDNGPRITGEQCILRREGRSNIYQGVNGRMIKALSCGSLTFSPHTESLSNSKEVSVNITFEEPYVSMNHVNQSSSEESSFRFNHSQCSHKLIRKICAVKIEEIEGEDSSCIEYSPPDFEPNGEKNSLNAIPEVDNKKLDPTDMGAERNSFNKVVCDHNLNWTETLLQGKRDDVGTKVGPAASSSADVLRSRGTNIAGDTDNTISMVNKGENTGNYVDMSLTLQISKVAKEDSSTTQSDSYVDMTSYPLSILSAPFWQDNVINVDIPDE